MYLVQNNLSKCRRTPVHQEQLAQILQNIGIERQSSTLRKELFVESEETPDRARKMPKHFFPDNTSVVFGYKCDFSKNLCGHRKPQRCPEAVSSFCSSDGPPETKKPAWPPSIMFHNPTRRRLHLFMLLLIKIGR